MTTSIRDKARETLTGDVSHLLVEIVEKNLPGTLRSFLRQQGIAIQEEATLYDDQGRAWLVMSIPMADISQLVLALIEKGFSGNVQGINAPSFKGTEK